MKRYIKEGYTCANDKPPTIVFGAESIPIDILDNLNKFESCCLSLTNVSQLKACKQCSFAANEESNRNEFCAPSFSLDQLGFKPKSFDVNQVPGVDSSSIHLQCSLLEIVKLDPNNDRKGLVILEVDTFDIDKKVLRAVPREESNGTSRNLLARIEADQMEAIGSLGDGNFARIHKLYHMFRPKAINLTSDNKEYANDSFTLFPPYTAPEIFSRAVKFTYKDDPNCILGYNPTKQTTLPRPIGWISTYTEKHRVKHLAPYSFFIDVARGKRPMVAFISYTNNGTKRKDAQTDAEDTGVFAWNVVTEKNAELMNLSSAGNVFLLLILTNELFMYSSHFYNRLIVRYQKFKERV